MASLNSRRAWSHSTHDSNAAAVSPGRGGPGGQPAGSNLSSSGGHSTSVGRRLRTVVVPAGMRRSPRPTGTTLGIDRHSDDGLFLVNLRGRLWLEPRTARVEVSAQVSRGAGATCRSRARTPEGVLDTSGHLGKTWFDLRKRRILLSDGVGRFGSLAVLLRNHCGISGRQTNSPRAIARLAIVGTWTSVRCCAA